jgi:hypothetical protein
VDVSEQLSVWHRNVVGAYLATLDETGRGDADIVTADHSGQDSPWVSSEDMAIPWIVSGRASARALTSVVQTMDTAATSLGARSHHPDE